MIGNNRVLQHLVYAHIYVPHIDNREHILHTTAQVATLSLYSQYVQEIVYRTGLLCVQSSHARNIAAAAVVCDVPGHPTYNF